MVVVAREGAALLDDDGLSVVLLPEAELLVSLSDGQLPALAAVVIVQDGAHVGSQFGPKQCGQKLFKDLTTNQRFYLIPKNCDNIF